MLTEALWKIIDIGAFGALVVLLLYGLYKITPEIKEIFENLTKSIDTMRVSVDKMNLEVRDEIRNQAVLTRKSLAINSYTDEKILDIASDKVLARSFEKLEYLHELLMKNNLKTRRKEIERKIRAGLIRYSNDYIKDLNTEDHRMSTGELMGDWISNNFPMEEFLEKLFKIFFRETEEETTTRRHNKINDIQVLMFEYQEALWKECKNQLIK